MRYSTQVKPISYFKADAAEVLALLKILALGNQDVASGKIKPAADVIARLRAKNVNQRVRR